MKVEATAADRTLFDRVPKRQSTTSFRANDSVGKICYRIRKENTHDNLLYVDRPEAATVDGGAHLEIQGIREAVGEGWRVGVCGWQHKTEQGVKREGGVQGDTVPPCDFITEFVSPGGGHGRRGAGMRLLHLT